MSSPFYLGLLTIGLYILRSLCGNGLGICSRNLTSLECCNNYHLNKDRTDCVECDPGFWQDCKTRCFEGYYGRLCESKCACKNGEICDYILGCVKKSSSQTAADKLGNCSDPESRRCCLNYYEIGNECVACPDGYYSVNCSLRCPSLRYGKFCGGICDCNASLCHHEYGCQNNTDTPTPGGFWDKWWVPIVFYVGGGLLVLGAITGIVFCFLRKKKTEFNPKHINNASQRQQSRRENGQPSPRRPCVEEPPTPCDVEPVCGAPTDLMVDNYENPYAQITDTARLMPRTRHTPKVVSTPTAPLLQQQANTFYKDDSDSYDILSLKVGLQDEIDMASSSMTSTSSAHWAKKLPTPVVEKPLPTMHRSSFLFPADSSGYIPSVSSNKGDRSSEAEIKSLPMPPPPPSNAHLNGFFKKKGKKPPPPPLKPPKGSAIYSDNGGRSNGKISGSSNDGELESETERKQIIPNNVCRRKKSLKSSLLKDAMNKRKTNGKSYNLSGLLEIEDMPLPEFDEGETSCHGSSDPLQNNGVPHTNMITKCQTALKSKMNRISALKLTSNTLQNLRYSFAKPNK